mgnify:CR=1 FL=1
MALFVITYDEPDALASFADEYGITYPLLSDPDSIVIERFGILNTLVDPDDHPWYGIPFPGSYVLDSDGVIVAKFFEAELTLRANADQLLRAALGEPIGIEPAPPIEEPAEVTVEATYDGEQLLPVVLRDLVVTLRVPEGQHLYSDPVPAGMVATSVALDDDVPVVQRDAQFPPTREHRLSGTGEVLHVYDGDVHVRVPITYLSSKFFDDDGVDVATIRGTVTWQSCDDTVCHLPASHRFEIELPVGKHNLPEFVRAEGSPRMDFNKHFQQMTARRTGG